MKTSKIVAAAASAWLLASPCAHALTPEELFRQASPAVWVVIARDTQGQPVGSGSAVSTAPGRVVTNCHVLRKAASLTLRRERELYTATLEHPDPERDLCQLRADGLPAGPTPTIAPTATLRVGQKVYAIGAPRGLEQSLSDGLVSSLRRNTAGELEYIQVTAPISPGSSGGGLFDEQGRLIGITTAAIGGTAQNLNFARPAQWIEELPARARSAVATFQRSEQIGTAEAPNLPPIVADIEPPARPAVRKLAPAATANSTAPAPVPPPTPVPTVHAQPATASPPPAAASPVSGSSANLLGAEQAAIARKCSTQPRAAFVGQGSGVETYSVPCDDGYALILSCTAGQCREVR